MKNDLDEKNKNTSSTSKIEVHPYGVVLGSGQKRLVFVFKNNLTQEIFPVWLPPEMMNVAIPQNQNLFDGSTVFQQVTQKLLQTFSANIEECFFNEIRGHHQYVTIVIRVGEERKILRTRVEEGLILCFSSGVRFFVTQEVMEKSRDMDSHLAITEIGQMMQQSHPPKNYYLN